ncbi:MAG: hypothetical protein ACOY94_11535 [Bacillota bacterium]
MKSRGSDRRAEGPGQPDVDERPVLPADWEHRPELAQALRVLVEGAVRLLRERQP